MAVPTATALTCYAFSAGLYALLTLARKVKEMAFISLALTYLHAHDTF